MQTPFGKVVIHSDAYDYALGTNAMVFSKNVFVEGEGFTLKCDTLKVWLSKKATDLERLEATGHVRVTARQTTSDGIKYDITGRLRKAASLQQPHGYG